MILCEGKWITNSSTLIFGEAPKDKNYEEVGKTEGKLLNDSSLRGRHRIKSYCEWVSRSPISGQYTCFLFYLSIFGCSVYFGI